MALTDTKLQSLRPSDKPYQIADGGGLFIEVMPGGKCVWRLRYRLHGKQEKVTLGDYPTHSLLDARKWRGECKAMIGKGSSPMKIKRQEKKARKEADTVGEFADRWMEDVVEKNVREPRNTRRVLDKDVIPLIGDIRVSDVTVADVLEITDRIKARGSDYSALMTRNVMKRLFAYAIAREKTKFNPAAAVEARYIAQARSRDVALTAEEIGKLFREIYRSSMRRSNKLGLHLLVICMVRKSELIEARWGEVDLDAGEWQIPGARMKKDKTHVVYLSTQATGMFDELRGLACGSSFVMPSRGSLRKPISKSTLNVAIRAMGMEIRDFVIHDFRRTASTHLHEAGFNSDWIEKALSHEQRGVRGVYNRAEYADQRREMLQWWADFVDAQIDERQKVVVGRFGRYESRR